MVVEQSIAINRQIFYDPIYDVIVFEKSYQDAPGGVRHFFHTGGTILENPKFEIYKFLQTVELLRLNFLRQAGLSFLEFPSAVHTRFSHSIGTCYLGCLGLQTASIVKKGQQMSLSRALENLSLTDEFLLSLLLHDIGHAPFSHILETNFDLRDDTGRLLFTHEDIACELINKQKVHGCNNNSNRTKLKTVSETIAGITQSKKRKTIDENVLSYFISKDDRYLNKIEIDDIETIKLVGELTSGVLDLDRSDHYLRDSFFSGLKLANFNFRGLLCGLTICEEGIKMQKSAVSHAISMLLSKNRLKNDFFDNINVRAYETMLNYCVSNHLSRFGDGNGKSSEIKKIFRMTDDQLLYYLSASNDNLSEIIGDIRNKKSFNLVGSFKIEKTPSSIYKKIKSYIENYNDNKIKDVITAYIPQNLTVSDPSKEWLNLGKIMDETGKLLKNLPDYERTIEYIRKENERKYILVFTSSNEEGTIKKVRSEIEGII